MKLLRSCSPRKFFHTAVFLLSLAFILSIPAARADSWFPATKEVYFSPDKETRLTVDPRELSGPLEYFEDKVDGKEPAGQKKNGNMQANGRLEQKNPDGTWSAVWEKPLVNEVAPVSVLVANAGQYVVTFDNWHSMGYGDDAIVIYNAEGLVIRAMSLKDVLPEKFVAALPRSVSSLHWGGEHILDMNRGLLNLKISMPGSLEHGDDTKYVDVFVDLATATVQPPSGSEWDMALAAADAENVQREESARKRLAFLTDPLLGPKDNSEGEWHDYLREAFSRTTSDWTEDSTSTTVLRAPDAKDYKLSRKWVKDALYDDYADNVSIGSQSYSNLAQVLIEVANATSKQKLKDVRLYVAVTDLYWSEIRAAFVHTGATLVQINPDKPILQNPRRLKALTE